MKRRCLVAGTILVFALTLLTTYFLREVPAQRNAARSSVCQHHLAVIYRALYYYHQKYGKFPPAYITDKHGKPMHSWRVLVLETLGDQRSTELYRTYRFDEPWDGPNNRKLADQMPDFFACPNGRDDMANQKRYTNYLLIIGPNAVFRDADSISIPQVADIHADTILVAETLSEVPWLEPKDLESEGMSFEIDDSSRSGIGSRDSIGTGIVLLDGRVDRLRKPFAPYRIKSMIPVRLTGSGNDVREKRGQN